MLNRKHFVLFASFCLFFFNLLMFNGYLVDDAYISFRFIKQWTNGNGLVFNIGEYVESYSNFLWVMLLTPFFMYGADLFFVSKVLDLNDLKSL